jgi:2-aminoadipate transaminase
MLEALREHMPEGVTWNTPNGGMFLWLRMPEGIDTSALFDTAVANGVAFVPGSAFYASRPDVRTMRLSFVTMPADKIRVGIAKLAAVIRQAQ